MKDNETMLSSENNYIIRIRRTMKKLKINQENNIKATQLPMEQENNEGEKPREGFSCCENDDEKL